MHTLPARSHRSLAFSVAGIAAIAAIGLIPWRLVAQSPPAPAKNPIIVFPQTQASTTPYSSSALAPPPIHETSSVFAGILTSDTITITQISDGTPIKVNVTEGTHVKQGDPLITFDPSDAMRAKAIADIQLGQAQKKLGRMQPGSSEEEMDEERVTVQLDQIAARKAEEDLAKTKIISPIDGIVSESHVKIGQFTAKGTQLLTIVDTGNLTIEGRVPQSDLSGIHLGQKISMTTDAYPNQHFDGQITFIAPTIDPAQGCVVKASVKGNTDNLKPGMLVTVRALLD